MSNPGTTNAAGPAGSVVGADILARINEREWEIERILGEEREAAEARVLEARRAAAEVSAARSAEADRRAAQAGEEVIAHARGEAAAIREAAAAEGASLLATDRRRVDLAADRMLTLVLPPPPGVGETP